MKNTFEIIRGGAEEKVKRKKRIREKQKEFYKNSYFTYKYGFYDNKVDVAKAVFYGIKFYALYDIPNMRLQELLAAITEIQDIKTMFAKLPVSTLIHMFPIIKEYNGGRYECKDYYSTINYLKSIDINMPLKIGEETELFFWNYYNSDIMNFSIKELLIIDRIRRLYGKKSLLESFIEESGLQDKIHTYSINREKGIMVDNYTGEVYKIEEKTSIPKEAAYFQIINKNDHKNQ